jgi:hypothetical protein
VIAAAEFGFSLEQMRPRRECCLRCNSTVFAAVRFKALLPLVQTPVNRSIASPERTTAMANTAVWFDLPVQNLDPSRFHA